MATKHSYDDDDDEIIDRAACRARLKEYLPRWPREWEQLESAGLVPMDEKTGMVPVRIRVRHAAAACRPCS